MLASNDCRIAERRRQARRLKQRRPRDRSAAFVIELVGAARGISCVEVLGRRRSQQIAGTRQLAMYLVHVLLGRTYEEVGEVFGRDRTTVSYACARIEDRRDDRSAFDREIEAIEAIVAARLAGEVRHDPA